MPCRVVFTDDFREEIQASDPTLGLILTGKSDGKEMRYFFATSVKLIPERRSVTTSTRSILSGARPIRLPSNFARRIPARTLSTIKLLSSSAIAPTITTIARPSGPPVSIFSRRLTNSTLRWLNSLHDHIISYRHINVSR